MQYLGEGKRVAVYRTGDRALRVPHDPIMDDAEIKSCQLLETYLPGFLPNPTVEEHTIDGLTRSLVTCDYVSTPYNRRIPSRHTLSKHLHSLRTNESRINYLESVRRFVDGCKMMYDMTDSIPDLAGVGNLVSQGEQVTLLDMNNPSFQREYIGDTIHVPVDDQGYPVFDMSLRTLYHLEKYLLSQAGNNYSTPRFNRDARAEEIDIGSLGLFVTREELKEDPFYGALRFKARREAVDSILQTLDTMI